MPEGYSAGNDRQRAHFIYFTVAHIFINCITCQTLKIYIHKSSTIDLVINLIEIDIRVYNSSSCNYIFIALKW